MSDYTLLSCVESVVIEPTELYGRFALGNFTKGQGLTIANALRRCLLSQVIGCSICFVEIRGIEHEYESLPGMKESVLDLLFNLRQLILKSDKTIFNSQLAYLNVLGPGIVRARDLKLPYFISVVDPNQHIATLSPNSKLVMKLIINCGKTYLKHNPSDFDYDINKNKLKQRSWFKVGYQPPNNLAYSNHWTNERSILLNKKTKIENFKTLDSSLVSKSVSKKSDAVKLESNKKHSKISSVLKSSQTPKSNNTRLFNDPLADHLQEAFHKQTKPTNANVNVKFPGQFEGGSHSQVNTVKKIGCFAHPIDAIFAPVLKVTYTIESISQTKEKIYFEIWTNGSIEPRQAIHNASKTLIELFLPLQASQFNDQKMLTFTPTASKTNQLKQNLTLKHSEFYNFKLRKPVKLTSNLNKTNAKSSTYTTKQNQIETFIYWLKIYAKKHPKIILKIIKFVLKPKKYRVQVKFGVVRSNVIKPINALSASEKLIHIENPLLEHRLKDRIIVKARARSSHNNVQFKKPLVLMSTKEFDVNLIQAEKKLTKVSEQLLNQQHLENKKEKQKRQLQKSLLYFKYLILNVDINQLNFPYNIYLSLKTNKIHTIEQLINLSMDQLKIMTHLSSKDLKSVQVTIKNYVFEQLTRF